MASGLLLTRIVANDIPRIFTDFFSNSQFLFLFSSIVEQVSDNNNNNNNNAAIPLLSNHSLLFLFFFFNSSSFVNKFYRKILISTCLKCIHFSCNSSNVGLISIILPSTVYKLHIKFKSCNGNRLFSKLFDNFQS